MSYSARLLLFTLRQALTLAQADLELALGLDFIAILPQPFRVLELRGSSPTVLP